MTNPVARKGDTCDHGATIIEGSDTRFVDGKAVARVGDKVSCPIPGHGVNPITTGSSDVFCDGKAVARVGSKTACGATIVKGSDTTFVS